MSLTAIRGKDWAFHALWAACGAYHQHVDPNSSEIMSNCVLDIPFTCIFQNGSPVKSLMTDFKTGKLKRVYVEKSDAMGKSTATSKGLQGTSLHPLQGMRKCLLDFSTLTGYDRVQQDEEETFIATVRLFCVFVFVIFGLLTIQLYCDQVLYTDDQTEHLTLKTLDMLLRNETWRLQVLIIQGYIPTTSVQTGAYSKLPQVIMTNRNSRTII